MKKVFLSLVSAMMLAVPVFGQTAASDDDVARVDSRSRTYRQGEVLVKLEGTERLNVSKKAGRKYVSVGQSALDAALAEVGITEMTPLMPLTGHKKMPRKVKAANGQDIEIKDLTRLYSVKFDTEKTPDVYKAVEALKAVDGVEFAEPNYLVYALGEEDNSITFNDPLMSEQWGLNAINLPALWSKPTISDERPVIAILDTGVDIEHPDLKANIWTNTSESEGAEGQDDDGNGFADDVHGWDFVNQTGHMDDFNGHGTHCAGIAGAVGNNGIGVVGANPDALIMPVTIMQSDGVGDVATIIRGIDYATANGADVISMSFGGYGYSLAEEQALGRAYANAVLVAAVGNDQSSINDIFKGGPMYPAAFQFVLGVEASTTGGALAGFSNFDDDGPLFSQFSENQLYNYELRAPGQGVYSTYPDGKYKTMSGTSMACPMAAGAISRLLQVKEYPNQEVLFGDLIHTRNNDIDVLAAYNITDADRKPALNIVTYELNDTEGGDGDLRADAGETIALYPTIKNSWGEAKNIKVWLTLGENEDETIVEFLDAEHIDFGLSLSSYAKAKSTNPIRFKVKDDCVDGRHINLVLHATCDNIAGELVQDFTITAENGVEIGGMVEQNLILFPNVHYIVTKTLVIPKDVTLTIKPGAELFMQNNTGIECAGHLCAKGTADSLIYIKGMHEGYIGSTTIRFDLGTPSDKNYDICDTLKYVHIENCYIPYGISGVFYKCRIKDCLGYMNTYRSKTVFEYGSLYSNRINDFHLFASNYTGFYKWKSSNIISNSISSMASHYSAHSYDLSNDSLNYVGNVNEKTGDIVTYVSNEDIEKFYPNDYCGSSRVDIIQNSIWDIERNYGYNKFYLNKILTRPNPEAPGIVWKVVVNGYDAQDEFEMLPPLGVGKHKFEVYYSKPVSKDFTPTIAMGVRPPYNSTSIAEEGSWNEAGDIYTAYVTITGKMANDGLNRISVEGGEDLEHFEIPIENTRFNVMIQAAGSMSSGFMGEAGLGKVSLTWEEQTEEDVDDILGYNMYRYQMNAEGQSSDTIRLNERMIDSDVTEFVDYDVTPGETYYYYYKIMRTSLTENSPSKTVAVTPLTASKGDANGSMTIDVADVVTEIGYLTNQNPQPFIFEAADVNSDLAVNILDVVGTINIILTPAENTISSINDESAVFTVENGILYVNTPTDLGGLQFTINAPAGTEFKPLDALTGFEHASQMTAKNQFTYLVYSMSGKTLKVGRHALLEIGEAEVEDVVLSDVRGRNVVALRGDATGISSVEKIQMNVPSPNPFREQVTIPYVIGKSGSHDVKLAFSDISGRMIDSYTTTAGYGNYSYTWKPNRKLTDGIYLVTLYVDGKLVQTSKLVHIE